MNVKLLGKIIGVCSVLGVLGFVLYQGFSETFAAGQMSKQISTWIYDIIIDLKGSHEDTISRIELVVRKIAHFIEYFILGTVVFIAVVTHVKSRLLALGLYFIITVPIPFIDEFIIQELALSRTSHLVDVFIDLAAIALSFVIGVMYVIVYRWLQIRVD